jgi:hypothetical protein
VHVVRVKDGARFDRIAPAGFFLLSRIHAATQVLGVDVTISCGTDAHDSPDPHVTGEAYDLSVAVYSPDVVVALVSFLRAALGPLFTVLYESPYPPSDLKLAAIVSVNQDATAPHIHVQRKRGTIWPPAPATALRA